MARLPGDRSGTRVQIMAAATNMFAERGYHATSLRELAARIGMSKAALHYHFPSKEELLDALLEPAFEGLDAVIDAAPAPPLDRATARTLLVRYQQAVLQAGAAMQLMDGDPSALMRPAVHRRVLKQVQALEGLLAGPGLDDRRRLRARAALGVLNVTCIAHPSMDEGPHCHPIADDAVLRREAVEAALDALDR